MSGVGTSSGNKAEDLPCSDKCRSLRHGHEICAIGTKGSDAEVVCLWSQTCQNYAHVKDCFGRTALHMASSTGKVKAVEWLIKREGSSINAKDLISGYTPLHRSIFFGQIHVARSLIKLSADLTLKDGEGLTPLDLCLADRPQSTSFSLNSDPTELYVWGNNGNYNLGTELQQPRLSPEPMEKFRKENILIKQVVMQKYHSVFLAQSGDVFSCGFGLGGRLGVGDESAVVIPKQIRFPPVEKCTQIAVGLDHTLFLMADGKVRSCGSNDNAVLGHYPPLEKLLSPKTINSLARLSNSITGITASRFHSVFYSPDYIYTCGSNHGQLGHACELRSQIIKPTQVHCIPMGTKENPAKFTHVVCNEFATVVRNNMSNIYVLRHCQCFRINTDQFDIKKMQVIGGVRLSSQLDIPLCIFILTTTGRLLIWREHMGPPSQSAAPVLNSSLGSFTRIFFNTGRTLNMTDISVSQTSLEFITAGGEAYRSVWSCTNTPVTTPCIQDKTKELLPSEFRVFRKAVKGRLPVLQHMPYESLKVKRIPNIYGGVKVSCDPKGNNFAIIQRHQKLEFIELPIMESSDMNKNMMDFFLQTTLDDPMHDILFQIGNTKFPAHRFIVASACAKLYKLVTEAAEKNSVAVPVVVTMEKNIHPRIFEQILQFVYTNSCDMLVPGKFVVDTYNSESGNSKPINWVKLTWDLAKKFGLESLCKRLERFELLNGKIVLKVVKQKLKAAEVQVKKFDKLSHKSLHDITLRSSDGTEFRAHQCILVSRLHYFHSMLYANAWLEKTSTKPVNLQLPKVAVEVLLDFIYTDDSPILQHADIEVLTQVLVMSDLFLMKRLSSLVEIAMADMIHTKNVADILYIATIYNAGQLKDACMQFICLNLASILENKLLDHLPAEIMESVKIYYRQFHPAIRTRAIRQTIEAPEEEVYTKAVESTSLDMLEQLEGIEADDLIITVKKSASKPSRSTKMKVRARTLSENDSINQTQSSYLTSSLDDNTTFLGVQEEYEQINVDVKRSTPISIPTNNIMVNIKDDNIKSSNIIRRKLIVPLPSQTMNLKRDDLKENTKGSSPSLSLTDFPSLGQNGSSIDSNLAVATMATSPLSRNGNAKYLHKNEHGDMHETNTVRVLSFSPSQKNHGTPPSQSSLSISHHKKKTKWKSLNETSSVLNRTNPNPVAENTDGRDPTNPWKISDPNPWKVKIKETPTADIAFQAIVRDEEEKKENLQRAIAKPLSLMLIEDEALNQLLIKYTSPDVIDGTEVVKVDRVCSTNYANPMWVHSSNSASQLKSLYSSE